MSAPAPAVIECLTVGEMETNCYLVGSAERRVCAVVDPGAEPERILAAASALGLRPLLIVNTHGHSDHIGANGPIKERTGAPLCIHSADAAMLGAPHRNLSLFMGRWLKSPPADRLLADGEFIEIGDIRLKVQHTPGHSPGGICLAGEGFVLSGDTLFAESIGRTDLPGCSEAKLFASIRRYLLPLPDNTMVYPGHGPSAMMGIIRECNPFVRGIEE
jgi:glyoxylase-like metal-dependent hydrolase (beta-lactamase superfamily II)